jgi:hypothetical protein
MMAIGQLLYSYHTRSSPSRRTSRFRFGKSQSKKPGGSTCQRTCLRSDDMDGIPRPFAHLPITLLELNTVGFLRCCEVCNLVEQTAKRQRPFRNTTRTSCWRVARLLSVFRRFSARILDDPCEQESPRKRQLEETCPTPTVRSHFLLLIIKFRTA